MSIKSLLAVAAIAVCVPVVGMAKPIKAKHPVLVARASATIVSINDFSDDASCVAAAKSKAELARIFQLKFSASCVDATRHHYVDKDNAVAAPVVAEEGLRLRGFTYASTSTLGFRSLARCVVWAESAVRKLNHTADSMVGVVCDAKRGEFFIDAASQATRLLPR